MGNPVVVAAQMAAHGDEVARLRAEVDEARAARDRHAMQVIVLGSELHKARETLVAVEAQAARVRELEYTLSTVKTLGAQADSAAVALLRRGIKTLASLTHGQLGDDLCICSDPAVGEQCIALEVERLLADARAFLEGR